VNDGTGWAGKVKVVLCARLEELSFRSAVASAAGVLAVTGLGVSLTVTTGGGHQDVALPSGSAAVGAQSPAARSTPAGSAPAVLPSPSASPTRIVPEAAYRPATHAAAVHVTSQPPSSQASAATAYPGPTQRPVAGQRWESRRTLRPGWPPEFLLPGPTASWFPGSRDPSMRPAWPGFGRPLAPATAPPFPLAPLFSHSA
jgi:hypothetical protein